jgi:opacity protein-like surface antigen
MRQLFIFCLLIAAALNNGKAQPTAFVEIEPAKETGIHNLPAIGIVGGISIGGNKKTKSYIILREIPFKLNQAIQAYEIADKIKQCELQLMNTRLFVQVSCNVAAVKGDLIFFEVVVKERLYLFPLPYLKPVDRNLNQWIVEQKASLDRVNYGIKFKQNNVSGRNDNLGINLIMGYTEQISFKYDQPFSDKKLKSGFSVSFAYARNKEANYSNAENVQNFLKLSTTTRKSLKVEVAYSYRPGIRTRHYFKIGYSADQIADTIAKLNPNYFGNGSTQEHYADLSYIVQYFGTDYNPYPTKGLYADATIRYRGLNKNMQMLFVHLNSNYTQPLFAKSFLYIQAAGIANMSVKTPPFFNKRLMGSNDFYMRGLEYYVVDGTAGFIGRATLRKELFKLVIKNPIRTKTHDQIPFYVYPKIYSDWGYAYDNRPDISSMNNKWLKTWGAGVDVVTVYDLVLKFEYSFNQFGQSGFFFHTRTDF